MPIEILTSSVVSAESDRLSEKVSETQRDDAKSPSLVCRGLFLRETHRAAVVPAKPTLETHFEGFCSLLVTADAGAAEY
jgi:hypothetical protein